MYTQAWSSGATHKSAIVGVQDAEKIMCGIPKNNKEKNIINNILSG